jgi:FkbM family methyltransferase
VLDAYPDYTFTDKVVFDCGSCCGLDAILFSKEVKHVYCLEPDARNFENLKLNTRDIQNITIIKKALFNHCGEIEFSSENTQGSMILGKTIDIPVEDLKKLRKTDSIVVKCTTLDEMVSQFGSPDIVKIDIEGAEYDLVDSMKSVLEHGSILIFEIHQRPGSLSHYMTLVNYIESFGYKVRFYQDPLLGDHISCVKQ